MSAVASVTAPGVFVTVTSQARGHVDMVIADAEIGQHFAAMRAVLEHFGVKDIA